jgi:hypothetical protein
LEIQKMRSSDFIFGLTPAPGGSDAKAVVEHASTNVEWNNTFSECVTSFENTYPIGHAKAAKR